MQIERENVNQPLKENCFITKNNTGVYGFYGLTYIEIGFQGSTLQDLYDLKECVDTMIKEVERLGVDKPITVCMI